MRRLWLLLLPISCLAPTEITLSITTDAKCSDLQGVAIAIGQPQTIDTIQPTTVTLDCHADGTIGTLVVVPGSAGDDLGVRVVAGFKRSVNDCNEPFGDGCIVARRELRYVPHTPLYLPIALSVDCAGVPCDSTSTCVDGQCKPSNIPDPTSCTTPDGCNMGDGGTTPLGFDPECGDMSGLGGGASWPMTSVCPTHISRTPTLGPQVTPPVAWDYDTGGAVAILSVPVVTSDGSVFFGLENGLGVALDLTTGARKWQASFGSSLNGNPAIGADGTLVITGSDGLMGIDGVTQKKRWNDNEPVSDIGIGAGEIVYHARSGILHATDGVSGTELWQAPVPIGTASFCASPAITADGLLIYVSCDDGTIAAVETSSHNVRWSHNVGGEGIPLAVAGGVYVPAAQAVTAYDDQGNLKWAHQGVSSSCAALAKDGTIVVAGNNQLLGLDSSNNVLWAVPTPNSITSCPVIDGAGLVFAVTSNADVVAVDPKTTTAPRWVKNVPNATDIILAKGGTLVLVTNAGHVIALR